MPSKTTPIAILGGGVWGLSTALHLTNDGYTNITVYERAEKIPSPYSASFDINKIIRAEYEDDFYTELVLDALEGWKTPLFGPAYHETGYIVATTSRAPQKAVDSLQNALASVSQHPKLKGGIQPLNSADDFRRVAWQLTGPMNGFKGYFNRLAGYGHSSNAMKAVAEHLGRRGVRFILGEEAGNAVSLRRDPSGRCTGFQTADGQLHSAELTIVALGAYAASLIPSLGHFAVARSWSVAHIQLTEEECDLLRGIPVTNVRDLGFFFEPDPNTRLFKLCPLGAGFTNTKDGISLPPKAGTLQDFIPHSDELKLRQLLRELLPWLADRPFVDRKLCWFADTKDSDYCIDYIPDSDKSLIVLSGDSGHGFKMMPVFGKWVLDLINKGEQAIQRWRWKDVPKGSINWGDGVSWRIGTEKEVSELEEEKNRTSRARL